MKLSPTQKKLPQRRNPSSTTTAPPGQPPDDDPRMVNAHRMQREHKANLTLLGGMLSAVLERAVTVSAAADSAAAVAAPSSSSLSSSLLLPAQPHFEGYNPELVFRAVNSLTVLQHTDDLQALLDEHMAKYSEDVGQQLRTREPALSSAAPTRSSSGSVAAQANEAVDTPSSNDADAADCDPSKRRRLSEEGQSEGAPDRRENGMECDAVRAQRVALETRCFEALVRVWLGARAAADELQLTWSPYASKYKSRARSSVTAGGLTTLVSASSLLSCRAAGSRHSYTILAAMVPFVETAVRSADAVLERAVRGYVAAIVEDVKESMPVPHGPQARMTLPTPPEGKNEEEEDGADGVVGTQDGADTPSARRVRRRRLIRAFTELMVATQLYVPRAQSAMTAAVRQYYVNAAAAMQLSTVPCEVYFAFAQRAVAAEKERARCLLDTQTVPLLREVVECALLGESGMNVVRRDFAEMFRESAALATEAANEDGDERKASCRREAPPGDRLALVWRVLSSCAHAPRDPLVPIFRTHIDELGAAAVRAVLAAAAAAKPAERAGTGADAARRSAVEGLLGYVRGTKRAITRSFAADEKLFYTQLDEALLHALRQHDAVVVEVVAAFVDDVFRRIEAGALPLHDPSRRSGPTGSTPAAVTTAADTPRGALDAVDTSNADPRAEEKDEEREEEEEEAGAEPASGAADGQPCGQEVLHTVAYLCTHFPSMDAFERLYWRDLARRLLHPARRVNLAAERCFLRIFEGICGNSFISKFEGMLTDSTGSDALTAQYTMWTETKGTAVPTAASPSAAPPPGAAEALPAVPASEFDALPVALDTRVLFLTSGVWPKAVPLPLRLPPPLQRVVRSLEQFYSRLHAKRLLAWQHQLSHGVLWARLTPTRPGAAATTASSPRRQLCGTLVQCVMLLTLDEALPRPGESMTMGELCDRLGVPLDAPEVVGSILGLCHPRCPVLQRSSGASATAAAGAPVAPLASHETLRFNDAFAMVAARTQIPFLAPARKGPRGAHAGSADELDLSGAGGAAGEVQEEEPLSAEAAEEAVLRDRGHHIRAAVVQFMKARRTAKHEELLNHLQNSKLPFMVTIGVVKKTVEALVEKGFVERKSADTYSYIA